MKNGYFSVEEAGQFTFFRIPKVLMTLPEYSGISVEAKFLYGMMPDRTGLSETNRWYDGDGNGGTKVYDISYDMVLFQAIENFINLAEKDDMDGYLLFLESVFPFMEKYLYRQGMEAILGELSRILRDETAGVVRNRARMFQR